MRQASVFISGQLLRINTVPGSARIKVQNGTGQEFFFDPDRQMYLDAEDASSFNPQSLGLDRERLTSEILRIDALRRSEVQELNVQSLNPDERAIIFDNGDFKYFVSIEKIKALKGSFSLVVTSQWKTAARPEQEQNKFIACIERTGLEQLQALISRELSK